MVTRILRVMFWAGVFDEDRKEVPSRIGSAEIRNTSLAVAQEGLVLLKNEDRALPLDRRRVRSVAIIGRTLRSCGPEGRQLASRTGKRHHTLEGIRSKTGQAIRLMYAPGCFLEGISCHRIIGSSSISHGTGGKGTEG